MKIFLDTANLKEIETGVEWGIIDGVTTNPSLAAKEADKHNFNDLVKKILGMVSGPVSLEVLSLESEKMVEEAKKLAKLGNNVVIKVPITTEGVKAIKILSGLGIKTNATLIFTPIQALLAAKAGASYVSPFVGRLDDIGEDGMHLVEDIRTIFDNYNIETEIIVASVRHPVHVYESALIGADIVTLPFNVLEKLFKHPKTEEGIQRFLEDWKKVKL
ncbi:MAG: fructose-6-phosphate aldolase [Thermoplasmata archaeon]